MEKVGFIGAFDKTDLLIHLAKIMTVLNKKVLIIDSSLNQKAKYIIPVINPTTSYVTEFEGFDVAVGFRGIDEIRSYLGLQDGEELEYDIALIDIDSIKSFNEYKDDNMKLNYFVTSFDLFSLKKGLEVLSGITYRIDLKKVLYTKTMSQEEDDYLNFLSHDLPIVWNEEKIYFPFEMGDQSVIIENQRVSKIKFRNLSNDYKDGLLHLTGDILSDVKSGDLRHAMKFLEKN